MKPNSIRVLKIKFGSFMKWNIYISITIGIVFGIIMFILSLLGADVKANLGQSQYHGIVAGVMSLFISPLVFILFGVIIGLLLFLPLKAALKLTNGIRLFGSFEIVTLPTISDNNLKQEEAIEEKQ